MMAGQPDDTWAIIVILAFAIGGGSLFGKSRIAETLDELIKLALSNRVAKVDPDAKPHSPIWRLVAIMDRHLSLHMDSAAHSPVDATEHDEQRVSAGLDNPAAMLINRRIDHLPA